MDKARKKNIRRIISAVCAVVLVALLAAMPLLTRQDPDAGGPQASILSGTVQTGSIETKLIGGGTLAEEDAVSINLPSAVMLKEFLVSNGDTVSKGDPIATTDRVTVMTAIAQVQETLEHLSGQIEAESEKESDGTVTALAGGTVKILYAEKGEAVQDVMLDHGALAVLSLDGLMAVDLEAESELSVGTSVTVTLSDETTTEGRIEKNLAGSMTISVEDDGYSVGDSVQVTAEDGTTLGSGSLYIYSPWNATAYSGTISNVKVTEGETVKAGDTILTLSDVGYSAAYRQLIAQRQAYEDLMLDLFEMYQTELITAPCDGVISGIDKSSVQLLSATGSFSISLLANAPDGNDEVKYANYVAKVAVVENGVWGLLVDPTAQIVTDYNDLSAVSADPAAMTQEVSLAADIPVYTLVKGEWKQVLNQTIQAGDILLFALDEEGNAVWAVRMTIVEDPGEEPTEPDVPEEPSIPTDPSEPPQPSNPTEPSTPSIPSGGSFPSSGGSMGSISGAFPQMEQEPEFELYSRDVVQIASVTPQDTMTMEITIDELDITALMLGMGAEVKINALGGEKFTASITAIGNTGSNNGGNSKFTVELTMDRAENMLAGMNATATIVLDATADVVTIPVDALVEEGVVTVVFTGYDEENQVLTGPVAVTTGVSDGETVQILDGLASGDTYYYAYYDTLEISFTPDFGGGLMFSR